MGLQIPQGIDGIPTSLIPDDPTQFVAWFKSVGIKRYFANADTRNAVAGTGISISGTISTPATIALSSELSSIFKQPFVIVGAPVAPGGLTDYRSIAIQTGVLSLADGGAEATITIGVASNGIGNTQIRQGSPASVIGNAGTSTGNVADIIASGNGQVLQCQSGALSFAQLAVASLAPIANDTVVGNISGSSAAPAALSIATLFNVNSVSYPSGAGLSLSQTAQTNIMTLSNTGSGGVKITTTTTGFGGNDQLVLNAPASGDAAGIDFDTNGFARWAFGKNQSTESGSNAGSDLGVYAFADSGSYLGNPILVQRQTGAVTINSPYVDATGLTVYGYQNSSPNIVAAVASGYTAEILIAGNGNSNGNSLLLQQDNTNTGYIRNLAGTLYVGAGSQNAIGISTAGDLTVNAPSSGIAFTVNGVANQWAQKIIGSSTSGESYGALIYAGTTSADSALGIYNQGGTTLYFGVEGDGGVVLGSSLTNKGAGTLNATGLYVSGTNIYQSGSFTGTLTGCTTSPTATIYYTIIGKAVILTFSGLTGTSNATTMTITGLPAALQPASLNQDCVVAIENNGVASFGVVAVNSGSGTLTFYSAVASFASTSFTNSGTKGVLASTIVYQLD